MPIRKATKNDIDAVALIYEKIHTAEEKGETSTGWERGVYPVRETALAALERDDFFVIEAEGKVVGSGILNKIQVDVYEGAAWKNEAAPEEVLVMHTLAIDPDKKRRGYGREFVKSYEEYAHQNGCPYLRIDTNEKNTSARKFYKKLGYEEIGIAPCVFNGIEGVRLVLLEKMAP